MKSARKRFTPEARRLIRKLPPNIKKPLRALTDEVAENPLFGKELKKELEGFRSARRGNYRVIYEYFGDQNLIIFHYLGRRKNVYELFEQLLLTSPQ